MPTFLGGALAAQVPPMRLVSRVNEEYAGACPFCGGDQHRSDRFHIWLKPTGQERFWCRRCDRKGRTAQLLGDTTQPRQAVIITPPLYDAPRPDARNIAVYRSLYGCVADWAMTNLHQPYNPEPLAYLHRRGFSTETVRWARLGYALRDSDALVSHLRQHASHLLRDAEEAGVLARDRQGQLRTHPNLCGRIVIPYLTENSVVDLRTRRFPGAGYASLGGGYSERGATVPFCWDVTTSSEVVIITEGEFKALAVTAAFREHQTPYPAISHPGLSYFRPAWARQLVQRGVRVAILVYDTRATRPRDAHGSEQLAPEEYWTIRHGLTLADAGLQVFALRLPLVAGADKEDLDSFLLAHSLHALTHLLHTAALPLESYITSLSRALVTAAFGQSVPTNR